jgi:DNA-binding FrmR family transcriptional regulator
VITQLAAVGSAVDRAGFAIVSTALRDCLADESASEEAASGESASTSRPSVDEIERLFLSLA